MPSSAAVDRGQQMSVVAEIVHEMKTDPKLKELLDRVWDLDLDGNNNDDEQPHHLTDDERRLVELERKAYLENERVPVSLASKAAGLSTSAYSEWVVAKEKQDFALFAPTLQECFDTAIEIAEAKRGDDDDEKTLYDQMLDENLKLR